MTSDIEKVREQQAAYDIAQLQHAVEYCRKEYTPTAMLYRLIEVTEKKISDLQSLAPPAERGEAFTEREIADMAQAISDNGFQYEKNKERIKLNLSPAPQEVTFTIRELIRALEGASSNTDTDARWRAANCLREIGEKGRSEIRIVKNKE